MSSIQSTADCERIIICDGSCIRNPGPGGWAYGVIQGDRVDYYHGSQGEATNNIMELTAMIQAIEHISMAQSAANKIYTDSIYVVNGINSWLEQWKQSNWKNSQKKTVKNLDLWQKIDQIYDKKIKVKWIKGHARPQDYSGREKFLIEVQNQVDQLARNAGLGLI